MPLLAAIHALGTRAELVIDAPETPALRAVADEVMRELRHWHDRLSLFQADSFLSHINRGAFARPVPLDGDLWSLFALCDRVHRESGGAFDPTVAGLMSRAGLHPGGADAPIGWSGLVELDERASAVRFARPDVRLDLGGVAKGFALDHAGAILVAHGVESALLHAGTSAVVAIGPAARRVAVRARTGFFALDLLEASLCVSAPRGRSADGVTHIMDPARSAPAQRIDTAAVIARGPLACAEADAWATALVAGAHRPAAMAGRVRSAIHDGQRWIESDIPMTLLHEAA